MSERTSFRGRDHQRGTSGPRGTTSRGGRGTHHTNPAAAGGASAEKEKPKKENILDLSKYADKRVIVKFSGGREVAGTLKGWDQLMNLVLDGVEEVVRDDAGHESTRPLGLLVARGTLLTSISPVDGSEEIENPFVVREEAD